SVSPRASPLHTLPPFPPRRSSDLPLTAPDAPPASAPRRRSVGRRPVSPAVWPPPTSRAASRRRPPARESVPRAARRILGLAERIDRKSTRLNSSHVAISYAVFCLE